MRKYNLYLSTMCDNWRKKLSASNIDHGNYSQEELFFIIEYWAMNDEDEMLTGISDDVSRKIKRNIRGEEV